MILKKIAGPENQALAAGGQVQATLDILPTSHVDVIVRFLNNGANTYVSLANALAALANVNISLNGNAFINGGGADLFRWSFKHLRGEPVLLNTSEGDNFARAFVLKLPFGRRLFDPNECMPGTPAGQFIVTVTAPAAFTNLDNVDITIQQNCMPGASPKNTLRQILLQSTMVAGQENKVPLPIGASISDLIFFSTTVPSSTSFNTTCRRLRLEKNDITEIAAQVRWEELRSAWQAIAGAGLDWSPKVHRENTAGAYTQNATTAEEQQRNTETENYGLLDLTPNDEDTHLWDLRGANTANAIITADDAQQVRIITSQLFTVAQVKAILAAP